MNAPYLEHPDEDALERFLLKQSEETELEIVETHLMACEACVTRLETMEFNIAATKMALRSMQAEQANKQLAQAGGSPWKSWLTLPRLSWAGAAVAACATMITIASIPRDVTLTAYRGSDIVQVPEWRPLHVKLNAADLAPGPVTIEVVDGQGGKIWHGQSVSKDESIDVRIPRLTKEGTYYLRIYSIAQDASSALAREFSLQAKPLL